MASTLGGNKAGVSVQERIKQLIEQGVPLTEATDQAHREAVAATELMFPTTEGDGPLPGVTTAVTFGDGSTGTRAGLQKPIARADEPGVLQKPFARADEPAVVQKPINRLEGVSAEAKQEILEAGGEVTPSVDVEERPTDPIRAGDPPENAEREFAGAGIPDPTLALDDFYPEMTDVDQQPTGIALPEQAGGQRIPRLLELLGGIGGQIAQSRAIGSSNRANAARQARANLQSALRGGGGGAAFQETPKVGLLGHLATGLKGLGTGLQDVRTDEVAAEQADFENLIKQRQLGLQTQGRDAERIRAEAALQRARNPRGAAAKPPNERFFQFGADLFLQNVPREEVRARILANPELAEMAVDFPDLLGQALEGYEDTRHRMEQEKFSREAGARSDASGKRAAQRLTTQEQMMAVEGYKDALAGQVLISAHSGDPFADPIRDFEIYGFDRMGDIAQASILGAYRKAHGEWYKANHEILEEQRERERKIIAAAIKADKDIFNRMESLRTSLQALPGVKAFSGLQGIGGAFQRMDGLYKIYAADPGEGEARGAFQNAIVQNFQRMIDPATVRLGDIDLIVQSQSAWARFKTAWERIPKGGFVDDSLLREMHRVAASLHDKQRVFVQEEVDGAITVWNSIHSGNQIPSDERNIIVDNILGGGFSDFGTESDAERLERIKRERATG